jgi:hypothetical protein
MIGAVAGRHHVVENPLPDAPLTVGILAPQCRRFEVPTPLAANSVRTFKSKAALEAWT